APSASASRLPLAPSSLLRAPATLNGFSTGLKLVIAGFSLISRDLPLSFSSSGVRVRPLTKDGQMKRARFTEEQIIAVLKEHEAGAKTADLARKHGISEATLYNWKAKYGGMDVSEAKRLKALEDENAKLKKLLAEQMLDAAALRELLSKKW
ncbi:MAG: transposase, partial [Bradyrhizobium sp.]|nr:transposase [Bradyrhizobium sp.]